MADDRNIVLVGFMGTGKSTIGRLLAKQLERKFVDSDQAIVKREGRTIPEIFETDGESAFRKMEADVIQDLASQRGLVIGAGGGVVLDPENVKALEAHGVLICLRAKPETILKRVGQDSNRPLLSGDREASIRRLIVERDPYYSRLNYQIDTDDLEPRQVVVVIRSILDDQKKA